jgi:hypothetical protein
MFSDLVFLEIELDESVEAGLIDSYLFESEIPLTDEQAKEAVSSGMHKQFITELQHSNGRKIEWESLDFRGNFQLLSLDEIMREEPSIVELCDQDPEMDQEMRNFRLFDVVSMNSCCGFFLDPKNDVPPQVFHYSSGDLFAKSLGIDFKGYITMACESKIFPNWQLVLLDIKNNRSSKYTEDFKQNIVQLFPDFDWNKFVGKYNELRG